jgi:hypothetical protein
MKKNPHKIVKIQKTPNIMKIIVCVLCNLVVVKVFIDECNGFNATGFLSGYLNLFGLLRMC